MRKKVLIGLILVTVVSGCGSPDGEVTGAPVPAPAESSGASATEGFAAGHGQQNQARGAAAPANATEQTAADFLIREYRVSRAEAERRLKLQQDALALSAKLAAEHPAEYGGMWLDQANGGVLRVGMTDPTLVPALPGVTSYQAKRSQRALDEIAGRVTAGLGGKADVTTDPVAGVVVVTPAGATDAELAAAKAIDPEAVQVTGPAAAWAFKCDPRYCAEAPLRGGVRLDIQRDDGSVGGCSFGYHLRSKVTGKRYILTAGHCVLGPRHTHVDTAFHQWKGPKVPVSIEDADVRLTENDTVNLHDYAIMPFQPGAQARWFSKDGGPIYGPMPITTHDGLKITGLLPATSVQKGWTVCAAGSGFTPSDPNSYVDSGAGLGYVPGTHCGVVDSVGSRIVVKICARKGDSGGPLFTPEGKALGVLSGGHERSGACVSGDSELNWYSPLSRIFERVTQRTGTDYQFELTPQPGY